VTIERTGDETIRMTIRDDAPSERRRRSIEVLEERARTLGAALSVETTSEGSTLRLELPMYAASQ
jgi:signal transduction histidine kinase